MITDEENNIFSSINVDQLYGDNHPELQGKVDCICRSKTERIMANCQLMMGQYHGKLQVLPPLWKFHKINTKQFINTLYVGNGRDKISPFALLSYHNVVHLMS